MAKTAISVPDATFEAAERAASRLGISRSELYSLAVREYIAQHRADGVTEALDRVYATDGGGLDQALARMQLMSLSPAGDW